MKKNNMSGKFAGDFDTVNCICHEYQRDEYQKDEYQKDGFRKDEYQKDEYLKDGSSSGGLSAGSGLTFGLTFGLDDRAELSSGECIALACFLIVVSVFLLILVYTV